MEPQALEEAKEKFRQWLLAALEEHRRQLAKEREERAGKTQEQNEFTARDAVPKEKEEGDTP